MLVDKNVYNLSHPPQIYSTIMPNRSFLTSILSLFNMVMLMFLLCCVEKAWAQTGQCETYFETLTRLSPPDPGSYTVWDTLYGEGETRQSFSSALYEDGGVLALGVERASLSSRDHLLFSYFDRRGREVWSKKHAVKHFDKIVRMIPIDGGAAVLVNRSSEKGKRDVWIGFFNKEAKLLSSHQIADKKFDLTATDIVRHFDGGWIVSVSASRKMGSGEYEHMEKQAIIYKLDKNGNETFSRAYILGQENEILGIDILSLSDGGHGYIATGYFENGVGKKKAWVLRLADDMSIVWQKEFGRGISAKLNFVSEYNNGRIVVMGEVTAASFSRNGPAVGAWVMMMDLDSGLPVWQRYYMSRDGSYQYNSRDFFVNQDGVISTLLMGYKAKEMSPDLEDLHVGNSDYAHVVFLSPQGNTISSDAYYYGGGVDVVRMIEGKDRQAVFVGSALVPAYSTMEKSHRNIKKTKEVNKPLREYGKANLPNADVSDKAKKGLALLQKKIKEQDVSKEDAHTELASTLKQDAGVARRAWIMTGMGIDTYINPCQ